MRSRAILSLLAPAAAIALGWQPAAAQQLFNQIDASATSIGSWYSDNWYQLGTGFSGTLQSLTLQGYIDDSLYFASNVYLDEFLDSGYNTLNQTFTLSNNAPFTATLSVVTLTGLNIPIQPDRYYRLRTYQGYQNRSVILLGTNTMGLAMYDGFEYGVGIVYFYYTFYPYLLSTSAANFGSQSTANPTGFAFEPVNTATGNYFASHADLAVPGKGLAFNFTRSYNSLDSYTGPLGTGWTHSFNEFLTVYSDGTVCVKEADGQQVLFSPSGGGAYAPITPGVFDILNQNADGSFTFTQKNQTGFNFSPAGQLTTIVDRNGNTQALNYDGSGNLISILDSSGRAFTFTTDTNGRITSLTDPLSRLWQYGYDPNGNLISVIDAAGGTTQYAYDASHHMISATDPRGVMYLQNTYDSLGRVATQANARGFLSALAYNTPAAGTTTVTDPLGNATQNLYDANLRLVNIIDAKGGVQAYTYDANNDRTSVTDQNGHTTTYAYDANGNNTTIVDPLGDTATFTYDANNDLLTTTTPKANTTTFTYDVRGNLLTSKDPLGDITAYAYGAFGLLASKTDARGDTTSFSYDSGGNLVQSTDPLGNSTLFAYDGISRLASTTDPNGHTTAFGYDSLSRLLTTTDPLGDLTQFAYDPIGNLLSVTDANRNATAYAYDGTNNLTTVTDALGHLTTYTYDANNNRAGFTNANGNTTTYQYDALNRLVTAVDPLSFSSTYAYDAVGDLTATTDADKQANQFGYDASNRLTSATYADGSTLAYAYDADSNRTSMTDSHGVTAYAYNALDRVLSVTSPGSSIVTYVYNKVGNRAAVKYPDGKVVEYAYDKLNRLATVTDWAKLVTHYTYDKASNLVKTALPNSTTSTYHYDAANRLTALVNYSGTQPLSAFAYTMDAVGNRTQVASGSAATNYTYDALSRVTSWTTASGVVTQYAYDPFGNRLSMTTSAGTLKYSYDADDRLLTAGKTTFTYDANGNRMSEKAGTATTAYAYDPLNRLISVTGGAENTKYAYDGDGNRVSQQVGTGLYEYQNDTVAALPGVLNEQGPDGGIDYLYGGSMISATASAFQDFYQYDGLGSVVNVTNATGNAQEKYSYNPWGVAATSTDPLGTKNKYKFTGQALDPGTGLYYLRARYYDPAVGRFITRDPVSGFSGFPSSQNRYSYALNNPLRFTDLSGLSAIDAETTGNAGSTIPYGALTSGSCNCTTVVISNILDYLLDFSSLPEVSAAVESALQGAGAYAGIPTLVSFSAYATPTVVVSADAYNAAKLGTVLGSQPVVGQTILQILNTLNYEMQNKPAGE